MRLCLNHTNIISYEQRTYITIIYVMLNYYSGTNLPEFTFKTYQIEQMYAYKVIKNLEKLNDGISLPDIYHFIDMSLPFTKDDVTILEQEIIQQHQAH